VKATAQFVRNKTAFRVFANYHADFRDRLCSSKLNSSNTTRIGAWYERG